MMQPSYQQEEQNISNNHNGTFNAPSMVNPGTSNNKMLPHLIGPGSSPYNYPMVPEQKPFVQVRIIYRLSGQQCFFISTWFQEVPYQDPMEWCKISYYELSNRVGEMFYANGLMDVFIDGFTGSDANRFCLGQLYDVNRTSSIEQARRHIGNGRWILHPCPFQFLIFNHILDFFF